MKFRVILLLFLEVLSLLQASSEEEDPGESRDLDPESRKFHIKKKRPCYKSQGKFLDVNYNINYYGASPCGVLPFPQIGPSKPHIPFGGLGNHGGGFGGYGGGYGIGAFTGGHHAGGFSGGHRPTGYIPVYGGYGVPHIRPHKIIKDINNFLRPITQYFK